MTKLLWNQRQYESGVDRGVLYPKTGAGEAWNGLVSVDETPTGSEHKPIYVDGRLVSQRRTREHFSGSIGAFTYPRSFQENVLTQRRPKSFGMSYRVGAGKNTKIHLVYNVLVAPSSFNYETDETQPFRWDFTTLAIPISGTLIGAHLIIDAGIAYPETISDLEDVLYGTDETLPRLPLPGEVLQIFEDNSILVVVDNGDGTFTVTGPDSAITMLDSTTFQIDWPSVVLIDADTYEISSL
jgi:hypothetical protein